MRDPPGEGIAHAVGKFREFYAKGWSPSGRPEWLCMGIRSGSLKF